ncbi:hypothetical protein BIW11_06920 [Tropilaelaps mercedesae]|uniref:Uncharacterized protein n=1 Tax=Tropilaelaps mercedesae TaxID=418985 RepID=A0A1V9XVZ1_9ACAR|nr:hypothetical protein BIW11_06920 [Tropilaelaps mercedesae]
MLLLDKYCDMLAALLVALLSRSYAVLGQHRLYGDVHGEPLVVLAPTHDPRAIPPYKSPAYVGSFGGQQRYAQQPLMLQVIHHNEDPFKNHVSGKIGADEELGHGSHHVATHDESHQKPQQHRQGAPLAFHGSHSRGDNYDGSGHVQHVYQGHRGYGHHHGDAGVGGGGRGGGGRGRDRYGPSGPHDADFVPGEEGDHGYGGGPNEINHDDYYDEPHRTYSGGSDEIDEGDHHGGPRHSSDGSYDVGGHLDEPSGAGAFYGEDEGNDPHGANGYSDNHRENHSGHHHHNRPRRGPVDGRTWVHVISSAESLLLCFPENAETKKENEKI